MIAVRKDEPLVVFEYIASDWSKRGNFNYLSGRNFRIEIVNVTIGHCTRFEKGDQE